MKKSKDMAVRRGAREIVEARHRATRAAHDKNRNRWEVPISEFKIRAKTPKTPGDYERLAAASAKRVRKARLRKQHAARSQRGVRGLRHDWSCVQ
jgi:hypothetical protein